MTSHGCGFSPSARGDRTKSYLTRLVCRDDSPCARRCAHARRSRYSFEGDAPCSPKFPVRPIRSRCPICPMPTTRSSRTSTQKTLRIHHREHHATYVKKLNEALAEGHPDLQQLTLAQLLRDAGKLPEEIRTAVKNNGGGHLNHDLFWNVAGARAVTRAARSARRSARARFRLRRPFRKKFSDVAAQTFRERLGGAVARSCVAETRDRRPQGSRGAARQRCDRDCSSSTSGNTRTT